MAQLLSEIQWSDPILPPFADPEWEAELKRRRIPIHGLDRLVERSPWLREVCVAVTSYRVTQIPERLASIGSMVTSQESSCRYCYGASRAFLKILGYSESFISRLERDVQLAELDEKSRAFLMFSRNLARSMPRPAKGDREAMIRLGYSPLAVNEMAFYIAICCFYNRIGVLLACPPELGLERMANGFAGRLIGLASRVTGALRQLQRPRHLESAAPAADSGGPLGEVTALVAGLPGASFLRAALDAAFASPILPRRTKLLMFAVVARTLDCARCESQSCSALEVEGFRLADVQSALATLASQRLDPTESTLLAWVRGTVHYQTPVIQRETRAMAAELGEEAALEAIGTAALANATVRLAMLLD